uniref:REM-1 domain-containing protein n=1 Tax=Glossina palpalis gambiensis TaxID=67801 RepID=A0A1B0B630_9MUSC
MGDLAFLRSLVGWLGSDPRAATCRGKLQTRRCKLNQEINKELRLRAGAENLYKATTNRKLRDTVALELSFVNSNLQLLKEQLAELNSSVEIYQNNRKSNKNLCHTTAHFCYMLCICVKEICNAFTTTS